MKRETKDQVIESISALLEQYPNFYITDISGLNAAKTYKLRRKCYEQGVKCVVVKNTLLRIALKKIATEEMAQLFQTLEGNTAVMFTTVPNAPGKIIKGFNREGWEKPVLKGAYVQECVYVGADKLSDLAAIKTKEELVGDIIALLLSPIQRVIGALENKENAEAPAETPEDAPAAEEPATEAHAAE